MEAAKSFPPIEADGLKFMGAILSYTGDLLVLEIVADAADIRVKIA